MSADNGYVIQRRADGRVALQMYFLSSESLPNPNEAREGEIFDSTFAAEEAYGEMEEANPHLSEYGLTVTKEARAHVEKGWYALRDRATGKFIGLDSASGGYPYGAESLATAQLWPTARDANKYNAVSSWKDYDNPVYELHEVTISAVEIEGLTGDDLKNLR